MCGLSPSTAPRCHQRPPRLQGICQTQPSNQTINLLSLPHPADSDREQSPPAFNASKKNDSVKNLFSAAASVGSKRDGPSTQQRQGDCPTAPTDFRSLRCSPFGVHTQRTQHAVRYLAATRPTRGSRYSHKRTHTHTHTHTDSFCLRKHVHALAAQSKAIRTSSL